MDIVSGASLNVPDEPGCFTIDEHFILDLTEAVRQCALLTSPMKPLCKDDCAGLCPVCGRNLKEQCDCRAEAIDPRWSKLAKLASAGDDFVHKE